VGITGVPIENSNLGVGALAYSTLILLNDLINELNIESEFTLINSTGKKNDEILVNDKKIAFKNVSFNNPFDFKGLLKCLLFKSNPFLNGISKLDIIMHMTAGDSFTDIYGLKRFH
jgi:hypothetical protein